jgi:hypothetical protein
MEPMDSIRKLRLRYCEAPARFSCLRRHSRNSGM